MKRFAAFLAIFAVTAARDCSSECAEGSEEWEDDYGKKPNLIQDWTDQNSSSCDCRCSFQAPEGFVDHAGGKAQSCDTTLNTLDVNACTCTAITCPDTETTAKCVTTNEADGSTAVAADFMITAYAADDAGCKCMPAAGMDQCDAKYSKAWGWTKADGTACAAEDDGSGDSGAMSMALAGALSLTLALLM
jgi:hypothetical protein